jgi:phosphate starvation-inducible PhoH-like protein
MAKVQRSRMVETHSTEDNIVPVHTKSNALKLKLDHMKTFKPLTDNQKKFFDAYNIGDYFIALLGAAGTGKSFCAVYKALEEVMHFGNPFKKIIIVRSAVQSRDLGFTPGSVEDKMSLYEQPYIQIASQLFDRKDAYQRLKEQDYVEFISTSFVRGCSFDNSIVIVDEVQNLSFEECDTIITRVGHESKIIFCGDYRQTDLKRNHDKSGLKKFHEIAKRMNSFTEIEFTTDDIVRSSLVKEYIVARIEQEDSEIL